MAYDWLEATNYGNKELVNRTVVNGEIAKIKAAYSSNHLRVFHLGTLPVITSALSAAWQSAVTCAAHKLNDQEVSPQADLSKADAKLMKLASDQFLLTLRTPEIGRSYFNVAKSNLEVLFELGGHEIQSAVESAFHSMIVQSWTAFEVMAGDLWEQAVNMNAPKLSRLNGAFKKWQTRKKSQRNPSEQPVENESDQQKQSKSDKTVSVELLQEYHFDLSSKMGTLRRRARHVEFDGLRAIRDAYASAFESGWEKICDLLMDDRLQYLAATRNAIVHKAFIADQEFLDKTANCNLFSGIKKDDAVVLNGTMVREIIAPVFTVSHELIHAVDEWILHHAK